MSLEADAALVHHRRDIRRAAVTHALLITLLIVLWFVNSRVGFLGRIEDMLLRSIF